MTTIVCVALVCATVFVCVAMICGSFGKKK